MTAAPVWFGGEGRPLFGWFHAPAGNRARAGVVICPPFGREYLDAHYTLRLLAEDLEAAGFCVLRFDYDGTGDSAGSNDDPDRVRSWLNSIDAAVATVRRSGVSSVVLVGMRFGALLAGIAAPRAEADGLVLWDPVPSGRTYLAEQRALGAVALDTRVRADGFTELPGLVFDPVTSDHIRALDLTATSMPLAPNIHILVRPGRHSRRLAAHFDHPEVEWSEATGQAELLGVGSPDQVLPTEALTRIAGWISRTSPVETTSIRPPPSGGSAVMGRHRSGAPVVETPVSIAPAGLFGVLTDVPGHATGPTVLFLSVANEHRIGPNRLWVELARMWASQGRRACRVDLSGLGDSPVRHPSQRRWIPGPPEAFDDVHDAARAVSPSDPSDVVLVGLCSSAYLAIDAAFDLKPRGIMAINPVLSFHPPELATDGRVDPRRRVAMPKSPVVDAFADDGPLSGLRTRFPRLGWKIRAWARPRRRAAVWLRHLVSQGTDVLLVCGDWEVRPIRAGASTRTLARLERTNRFRFEYIPGLEHGLLVADHRRAVVDILTAHALDAARPPELDEAPRCAVGPRAG